ncbi:MAG: Cation efflux system protein CusA [Cyanobacteriota bacterium]
MQFPRVSRWNLSHWALDRPRLTIGFWMAIAVAGILAFSSLKYALFPEVSFPVVIVQGAAAGLNIAETEVALTTPLEQELKTLSDIALYSSTYAGQTIISVTFPTGQSLTETTATVEDKLQNLPLPPGSDLQIWPFNLNESVAVTYAVQSSELALEDFADLLKVQVIPQLEAIDGVLRVNLLGNANFRLLDDTVANTINPPTLTRYNGDDVLALQVVKTGQANTLTVVNNVQAVIQTAAPNFPQLQFIEAETQADYIREATRATIEALLGAIALAVLVIYPFLGSFRATLISAIAIPLSLLGTCIVMAVLGFNLETLTLLALALVIGIVVDDAIVDVENIARHLERGLTPKEAAKVGTQEIGLTVTATTVSIVVVFLPVALLGGTLGEFFFPFAVTVAAAVIISLLVARTLSPVLAVMWLRTEPRSFPLRFNRYLQGCSNSYQRLLAWSLRHRGWIVGLAALSFLGGLAIIPFIPQGFVPSLDRGEFNVVFQSAPPQLTTALTSPSTVSAAPGGAFDWVDQIRESPEALLLRRGRRIAEKLEPALLENPVVAETFTVVGSQGNPLKGRIYTKLKTDRRLTTQAVQAQIRARLPKLPKVTTRVENILFVQTGDDTPLKLGLYGDSLDALKTTARRLKTQVQNIPGLVQVELAGMATETEAIEHFRGQRVVYLTASLLPDYPLGDITQQVTAIAQALLPAGVKLDVQGESARVGIIFNEFAVAFALSIIGMLTIFLGLFRRLLEPLVVILSLPLSIVGAMLGLLLTQSEFGMISLIGLIFLLGLLDKNAILLIDYANQLRQQGYSRYQALLTTGKVRFRPILMTTSSTILGMMPLALGWGAGAELRQPMAIAIIGGLLTSTLLSLLVVPVLYSLFDDAWGDKDDYLADRKVIWENRDDRI